MNQNAQGILQSASFAAKSLNNLVAVKISSLIEREILEKYNRAILLRDKFWKENNKDEFLHLESFFQSVQKMCAGVTE